LVKVRGFVVYLFVWVCGYIYTVILKAARETMKIVSLPG
jgi:hypothetical protein